MEHKSLFEIDKNNALYPILQNECKIKLESLGYKFSKNGCITVPENSVRPFISMSLEIKRSKESNNNLAYHIPDLNKIEFDYFDMLNQINNYEKRN